MAFPNTRLHRGYTIIIVLVQNRSITCSEPQRLPKFDFEIGTGLYVQWAHHAAKKSCTVAKFIEQQ